MKKLFLMLLLVPVLAAAKSEDLIWRGLQAPGYKKAQAKAEEEKRTPSSESEYEQLVKKVLDAKTANDFQALIESAKANRAKIHDPSAQFLNAHLIYLEAVRGFFWRVRPFFERGSADNHNIQSLIVSFIKQNVAGISLFSPAQASGALLDYLASPFEIEGVLVGKIENEAAIQTFINDTLRMKTNDLISALNQISNARVFKWDRRISAGADSFADGLNRELSFGTEELQLLIAQYDLSVASMDFLCAYNQNGALDFAKQVGGLYGFDAFVKGTFLAVDGVTGDEIYKLLQKPQNAKLWKLNKKENIGQKFMTEAGVYIGEALDRMTDAWSGLKARPANAGFSLPNALISLDKSTADLYLANLERLFAGKMVRSLVTGKTAKVYLPKVFNNEAPEDLKKFFPNDFDMKYKNTVNLELKEGTKAVEYRNFHQGSAKAWNTEIYQQYFETTDSDSIARSLRVLNDVAGGFGAK